MTDAVAHTAITAPTLHVDAGGTRFAYRDLGPRGGVPLVLLHHFTAVIDDWDPRVIDGIATERRVLIFDNRGVGGTPGKVPTTVQAMADDGVAFLRALGVEQVDLLGFSLGGFIAQAIATKEPQLVRRFILPEPAPPASRASDS
ncbi:alpha/beta fold hydrolase [Saccharopolyspora sp. NPDC050389]|uniref:alpha/beta fold hydrolase n=1 Tax=Saccharopolyspora sp. NPDC050389 TaxID=3155516 RepID=UPI0033E12B75